ncbi:MAG: hypothetical protein NTX82_00250, partial [Candidatus Parcubacteria bacterium]|nr:hypothetical protein [Candidatus Parcubacteria bacterium]
MVNGNPNLEQDSLSRKMEESEIPVPKPENLITTKEGLESLRERTQYRIKSKMEASMQQGRENLGTSVDRLKGTPAEKAEGQERLKPVEAKIISLGDAYQKKISAELEAQGIGINAIPMPKEILPLEVPNVDFSKLPNETKASEALTPAELKAQGIGVNAIPIAREKQPSFSEDKLREGLKMQGVPPDIAEQIISQEKVKAQKALEQEKVVKVETAKPVEINPLEIDRKREKTPSFDDVKADLKRQMEDNDRLAAKFGSKGNKEDAILLNTILSGFNREGTESIEKALEHYEDMMRGLNEHIKDPNYYKQFNGVTTRADDLKDLNEARKMRDALMREKMKRKEKATASLSPEVRGDEKKLVKTEMKENEQAQELQAANMDMKKNLDVWNELIGSQMDQAGAKPEKQGRINKFFDKLRGLIDRTESLVSKILQRNKLSNISKLLSPEGRQELMNSVMEKVKTAANMAGKQETEPDKIKPGPKFNEKELRNYLQGQGVPEDVTEEIISQEKFQVKKLENKGRLPEYAKEVKKRLRQLENDIKYKARSVNEQMKDMKNDYVKFREDIGSALKQAGSEWKKMNVMESITSKFKSYLNRGQALMVTEVERRTIKKQQKKIEAERKQMLNTVEKQALARRKQETEAKEAARKNAQKEAAAKAKQEQIRADAQKNAAK